MDKIPNIINIKKITPGFNNLLTTAEKYKSTKTTNAGIITAVDKVAGSIKEHQIVTAIGPSVRNCKIGDLVKINPARYAIYKQKRQANSMAEDMNEHYKKELVGFNFNIIDVDGEDNIMFSDTDIDYTISEYESLDAPEILVNNNVILTQ